MKLALTAIFYKYQPPEPLEVIEEKIAKLEKEIAALLNVQV